VNQQFSEKFQKFEKEESLKKTDDWLELASWALEHGSLDNYFKVMTRLEKKDKDHPIVKAYLKTKEALERPIAKGDNAPLWISKLQTKNSFKILPKDHYTLLHQTADNAPEVTALLDHLERNMKSFYYWFAMRGKTLPVPDQRSVVVLLSSPSDFDRKREV